MIRRGELRNGYPRGDGDLPGAAHNWGGFVMHTLDGVRGRDVP